MMRWYCRFYSLGTMCLGLWFSSQAEDTKVRAVVFVSCAIVGAIWELIEVINNKK